MPRINVDDSLFKMRSWTNLIVALGDREKALGALVWAWITAQRFWYPERKLIPRDVWVDEGLCDEIIQAGLAEDGEAGVYVHGSEEQFKWLFDNQAKGVKSGEARRRKRTLNRGSTAVNSGSTEVNRSQPQPTDSNQPEPLTLPLSPPLTLIHTQSQTLKSKTECNSFDLEKIYEEYPKRPGSGKKEGIKALALQFKSDQDRADCFGAATNYRKHCEINKIEPQFIKQFRTWCGSVENPRWRDWIISSEESNREYLKRNDIVER